MRDELRWTLATLLDERIPLPIACLITKKARTQLVNHIDEIHDRYDHTDEHPSRSTIFSDISLCVPHLLELESVPSVLLDSPTHQCEEADQLSIVLRDLKMNEPTLCFNSERFAQIEEMASLVLNRIQWVKDTTRHIHREEVAEDENMYWQP